MTAAVSHMDGKQPVCNKRENRSCYTQRKKRELPAALPHLAPGSFSWCMVLVSLCLSQLLTPENMAPWLYYQQGGLRKGLLAPLLEGERWETVT